MAERDIFVDSWQMRLFDEHPVWEATIRIGLIPTHEHAQLQIEIHDPRTKVLAAMASWPSVLPEELPHRLRQALGKLADALVSLDVPAPWLKGLGDPF